MTSPDIDAILAAARPGLRRLRLTDGRNCVLNCRLDMPAGFLAAEVRGLALLAKVGGLRVPAVLGSNDSAVLLEDLGSGSPCKDYFQRAGRGLATQHGHRSAQFGLQHDGWCGDSRQSNQMDVDGLRFFAEQRLLPQARRARDAGLMDAAASAAIDALCARLPTQLSGPGDGYAATLLMPIGKQQRPAVSRRALGVAGATWKGLAISGGSPPCRCR